MNSVYTVEDMSLTWTAYGGEIHSPLLSSHLRMTRPVGEAEQDALCYLLSTSGWHHHRDNMVNKSSYSTPLPSSGWERECIFIKKGW